jgi:hypothetical protein
VDHFGIDTVTGDPIWRVVWSEDQFEKRHGTYDDITPGGLYLRTVTGVRLVPKYRQWIEKKYVLERLVVVPEENMPELPATKVSYEPIYVFENGDGNYLPPKFIAAKFVIDTIYATQYGTKNLRKYVDEENTQEAAIALKDKRVSEIEEALWGDQSSFGGSIVHGEAVVVPRNFETSKKES